MSSRHALRLQRLQEQQRAELTSNADPESDSTSEEEELPIPVATERVNPFALLGADEHGSSESEEDDEEDEGELKDDEDDEEADDGGQGDVSESTVKQTTTLAPNAMSRKARRKAQRRNAAQLQRSHSTATATAKKTRKQQDKKADSQAEFDQLLSEFGASSLASSTGDGDTSTERSPKPLSTLLQVDLDLMNGEREEKQLFGHAVVSRERKRREAEERARAQQMASLMARRGRRQARGGKALGSMNAKLVRVAPDWPRTPTGVHMEPVSATRDESVFAVRWSPGYTQQQAAFETVVQTNDPQMLMGLLRQYPYHVDTLLQIAQLYKQLGEFEKSADLIARCVYVFERSWHARFDVARGCSRLCYEQNPECRSFFVALFRHIQILGRKGCCRTALEYCRLLLALDPSDPLFVLLNVDYFALRADQYWFLFDLVQHYPATRVCEWINAPPIATSESDSSSSSSSSSGASSSASQGKGTSKGQSGRNTKGKGKGKGKAKGKGQGKQANHKSVDRPDLKVQRRADLPSASTHSTASDSASAPKRVHKTYRSLLLPNILYSVALARFHVERRQSASAVDTFTSSTSTSGSTISTSATPSPPTSSSASTTSAATPTDSPPIPLCQLPSEFRSASSSALLQDALLMFPMLYAPLASKLDLPPDMSTHPFFCSFEYYPQSLKQLIEIYVDRNGTLWQQDEVKFWLQENAAATLARVDRQDPAVSYYLAILIEEYTETSKSLFAHLVMSEYTDSGAGAALPADVMQALEGGAVDPFAQQAMFAFGGGPAMPAPAPVIPASTDNELLLFLQTLLPWSSVPNAPYQGDASDDE
mmetsp:Transcript_14929/g.44715  ORF Transcript_14929/g.44715 Transcript_14929/m.44715 type:complete len:823 (+) Transcript_14929:64-2532(+)